MNRAQKIYCYCLIIFAVGLRLALAIFNREANDDHIQVVQMILQTGHLPLKADCWECFQPKLFHFTIEELSRLFNLHTSEGLILVAQFTNLLLGLVALWVVWKLLEELEIGDLNARLLAIGLLALNPNLLTTNIQATNDTFVIAFSSLAIYFAWHFYQHRRTPDFVLMTLFAMLAASSKTNGLVTTAGIAGFFGLRALLMRNFRFWPWRQSDLAPAVLFVVFTLSLVTFNPLNQYLQNLQTYGSPVTMNMERATEPAQLFTPTETYRPGIVSVVDGFFTFKLSSLLMEPQINNDNHHFPDHRTSFWTILYGRSNFIQYDPWPPTWINASKTVRNLGRVLYLLALAPTLVLLAGFLMAVGDLFGRSSPATLRAKAGFFLALLLAYLGFAVVYALDYRIYTVIKTIFILPALPALAYFSARGFVWIKKVATGRLGWLAPALQGFTILLLIGYVLNAAILVLQLGHMLG